MKKKLSRETIERTVYMVLIILLVLYGFKDSVAAEMLLRALKDAFSILIINNP